MKYIPVLFAGIWLASCSGNSGTTAAGSIKDSTQQQEEMPAIPVADFYKCYTGTVAGQPVVLHLQKAGGRIDGMYYYTAQGKPINLYIQADTVKKGYLYITEQPETIESDNDAFWEVTMSGNKLAGTWKNKAGTKSYNIALQEDARAPALTVYVRRETIPYAAGKEDPHAESYTQLLLPAATMQAGKRAFVERELMESIGCAATAITGLEDCLKKQDAAYATAYREMLADAGEDIEAGRNNHYTGTVLGIVYSADEWLVYEVYSESYTGGAHGIYGSTFLNLDLRNNKDWQLAEIMQVDTALLSSLLEKEVRRYMQIPPAESLGEHLLEDEVKPNGNFFLTHKGITFNYQPYEIAAYAYGEVRIFIPYTAIGQLLTPAFKERMQLK